jgi:hypothetical protein
MGMFDTILASAGAPANGALSIGQLQSWERAIGLDTKTADVERALLDEPALPGFIVRNGGDVFGILSRRMLFTAISQPYGREVFIKRPLREMAAKIDTAPLMLPGSTPLHAALKFAMMRDDELRFEPFLVHSAAGIRLLEIHVLMVAQSNLLEEALTSRDRLLDKIKAVVGNI